MLATGTAALQFKRQRSLGCRTNMSVEGGQFRFNASVTFLEFLQAQLEAMQFHRGAVDVAAHFGVLRPVFLELVFQFVEPTLQLFGRKGGEIELPCRRFGGSFRVATGQGDGGLFRGGARLVRGYF